MLSRFSLSSNKLWPAVFVFWTPPGNPLGSQAQATDESERLPWVNREAWSTPRDWITKHRIAQSRHPAPRFLSLLIVFFLSSEMFGVGMSPWTDKKVHRPRDVAGRSHAPLPVECSQGLIFIKTNRFKLVLICYVKVTLKLRKSQKLLTIPQLFIFATFKMLFIYRFCCFTLIHTQTFNIKIRKFSYWSVITK